MHCKVTDFQYPLKQFYDLGFNSKKYLGLISLINCHLGCSTPSQALGHCPFFNLGLHQNVIVGFVLWAYYTSPIGFRFRPEGREWSRFIVDCGRLKGTSFIYSDHKVLANPVSQNIPRGSPKCKNSSQSISAFTRGCLYWTKLIYHPFTGTGY